jgi:hypothetical protein
MGLAVLAAAAGCTGTPPETPPTTAAAPVSTSPADPACAAARTVINRATARFTAAASRAITAAEQGDTTTRDAALADVKAAFTEWSATLRAQATSVPDLQLRAVLTEYAGAVDATVAQVHTAADLDRLSTFDDQELDAVASRFAAVCP